MKFTNTIPAFLFVFFAFIQLNAQENRLASVDIKNPIYSIRAYTPKAKTNSKYKKQTSKVNYQIWSTLLKKNVSATGKVNYKGFQNDIKKFNEFLRLLSNTRIDGTWSESDKISYWINVYNAFTVKLIVNNYPVSSIKNITNPWKQKFFIINGKSMNLSQVEHEILRNFNEPRIHFAINCASASCPRLIQIPYTSENLERLLERQTTEFINDPFYNTITDYTVNVSKLFDWYKKDFKAKSGTVINFINQYSKVNINKQKERGYKSYDWSINATK
ncbi:DUF547 domain-containing protein [Aquimarina agarilytica]|uniref:DUF547 domain-containing protein n=1 Tax=Aquimarina agarilytica TaxID=1087449 RepID=UPI00028A31C6|nr:DUF547 domain-containing protein [Aquimarina agarilytica]